MSTVAEIAAAASRLDPAEFLRLRQELDRLEQALWDKELDQASEAARNAGLTDDEIDRLVMRRRREIRS